MTSAIIKPDHARTARRSMPRRSPRILLRMRSLDQSRCKAQFPAQLSLFALHGAVVGLVIVTSQVEHAMEKQHSDLHFERVTTLLRLPESCLQRYRQIAGKAPCRVYCGKGKYIGRFVLAAVLAVQGADCFVTGEQHAHLAMQSSRSNRLPQEACKLAAAQTRSTGQLQLHSSFVHDHCWITITFISSSHQQ